MRIKNLSLLKFSSGDEGSRAYTPRAREREKVISGSQAAIKNHKKIEHKREKMFLIKNPPFLYSDAA
jgi:hypothetical protein